ENAIEHSKFDFFEFLFLIFSTNKDYFFGVTFIMLFANGLLLEFDLYFSRVDTITWKLLYDIIVLDGQIYRKCAKSQKELEKLRLRKISRISYEIPKFFRVLPNFLVRKYLKLAAELEIWFQLKHIDECKFR